MATLSQRLISDQNATIQGQHDYLASSAPRIAKNRTDNRWLTESALANPPATPSEGAAYLVLATATAEWAGNENSIAVNAGTSAAPAWQFVPPRAGLEIWETGGRSLTYVGGVWVSSGLWGSARDEVYDAIWPDLAAFRAADNSAAALVEVQRRSPTDALINALFVLDPNDTTSADNDGSVILDAAGNRFKFYAPDGLLPPALFGFQGDARVETANITSYVDNGDGTVTINFDSDIDAQTSRQVLVSGDAAYNGLHLPTAVTASSVTITTPYGGDPASCVIQAISGTDDRDALQAWINALGEYGGLGYIRKSFITDMDAASSQLVVPDNIKLHLGNPARSTCLHRLSDTGSGLGLDEINQSVIHYVLGATGTFSETDESKACWKLNDKTALIEFATWYWDQSFYSLTPKVFAPYVVNNPTAEDVKVWGSVGNAYIGVRSWTNHSQWNVRVTGRAIKAMIVSGSQGETDNFHINDHPDNCLRPTGPALAGTLEEWVSRNGVGYLLGRHSFTTFPGVVYGKGFGVAAHYQESDTNISNAGGLEGCTLSCLTDACEKPFGLYYTDINGVSVADLASAGPGTDCHYDNQIVGRAIPQNPLDSSRPAMGIFVDGGGTTLPITGIDAVANTATIAGHNIPNGTEVFTKGASGDLTPEQSYWTHSVDANTVSFHTSRTDSFSGSSAVDLDTVDQPAANVDIVVLASRRSVEIRTRIHGAGQGALDIRHANLRGTDCYVQEWATGGTPSYAAVFQYCTGEAKFQLAGNTDPNRLGLQFTEGNKGLTLQADADHMAATSIALEAANNHKCSYGGKFVSDVDPVVVLMLDEDSCLIPGTKWDGRPAFLSSTDVFTNADGKRILELPVIGNQFALTDTGPIHGIVQKGLADTDDVCLPYGRVFNLRAPFSSTITFNHDEPFTNNATITSYPIQGDLVVEARRLVRFVAQPGQVQCYGEFSLPSAAFPRYLEDFGSSTAPVGVGSPANDQAAWEAAAADVDGRAVKLRGGTTYFNSGGISPFAGFILEQHPSAVIQAIARPSGSGDSGYKSYDGSSAARNTVDQTMFLCTASNGEYRFVGLDVLFDENYDGQSALDPFFRLVMARDCRLVVEGAILRGARNTPGVITLNQALQWRLQELDFLSPGQMALSTDARWSNFDSTNYGPVGVLIDDDTASLRSLPGVGENWRIEGYARNAAEATVADRYQSVGVLMDGPELLARTGDEVRFGGHRLTLIQTKGTGRGFDNTHEGVNLASLTAEDHSGAGLRLRDGAKGCDLSDLTLNDCGEIFEAPVVLAGSELASVGTTSDNDLRKLAITTNFNLPNGAIFIDQSLAEAETVANPGTATADQFVIRNRIDRPLINAVGVTIDEVITDNTASGRVASDDLTTIFDLREIGDPATAVQTGTLGHQLLTLGGGSGGGTTTADAFGAMNLGANQVFIDGAASQNIDFSDPVAGAQNVVQTAASDRLEPTYGGIYTVAVDLRLALDGVGDVPAGTKLMLSYLIDGSTQRYQEQVIPLAQTNPQVNFSTQLPLTALQNVEARLAVDTGGGGDIEVRTHTERTVFSIGGRAAVI